MGCCCLKSYKRSPYKIVETLVLKNVEVGDSAFLLAKRINISWSTSKRVLFWLETKGCVKLEKVSPHKVLKVF